MTDREFRQRLAALLARQKKEAEEKLKKPPAAEAKGKGKRSKAS